MITYLSPVATHPSPGVSRAGIGAPWYTLPARLARRTRSRTTQCPPDATCFAHWAGSKYAIHMQLSCKTSPQSTTSLVEPCVK